MKILRIFGVVVGIHVFALVLIFANPGCSSPNKPAPSPSDTVSRTDDSSSANSRAAADSVSPVVIAADDSPGSSVPSSFDPNATATPDIRFSPTRPGTPAASTLGALPAGDVTPATTYTVTKGDSLWIIAKKHGVSVAEIAAANNIRTNATIRLGQKLIVPAKTVSSNPGMIEPAIQSPVSLAPAPAPAPKHSGSVKHVVRSGETLGAIARKYQVTVGEIATANNISDPAKIRQGMELVIPGWQAPRGQAKAAAAPSAETAAPASSEPAPDTTTSPLIIPAPESDTTAEPPVIRVQ